MGHGIFVFFCKNLPFSRKFSEILKKGRMSLRLSDEKEQREEKGENMPTGHGKQKQTKEVKQDGKARGGDACNFFGNPLGKAKQQGA